MQSEGHNMQDGNENKESIDILGYLEQEIWKLIYKTEKEAKHCKWLEDQLEELKEKSPSDVEDQRGIEERPGH